jgi:hypothetical protein
VTGGLRGKKRFAFLLFFKKKILRLKMKYRKEIVSGKIVSVSPRGIRLEGSILPRLYLFPRSLRYIAEILKPGMFVSFVYVRTAPMLSIRRGRSRKFAGFTLKNF